MSFKSYLEIPSMHKPLLLITDDNLFFFFLLHQTAAVEIFFIIQTNEDLDSESWFVIVLAVFYRLCS